MRDAETSFERPLLDTLSGILVACGFNKAAECLREEADSHGNALPVDWAGVGVRLKELTSYCAVAAERARAKETSCVKSEDEIADAHTSDQATGEGTSSDSSTSESDRATVSATATAEVEAPGPALASQVCPEGEVASSGAPVPDLAAASVPVVAPPPSEAYDAQRPGEPLEDGFADEYRDDSDPGYRILMVSEMELIADLQGNYQQMMSANDDQEGSPAGKLPAGFCAMERGLHVLPACVADGAAAPVGCKGYSSEHAASEPISASGADKSALEPSAAKEAPVVQEQPAQQDSKLRDVSPINLQDDDAQPLAKEKTSCCVDAPAAVQTEQQHRRPQGHEALKTAAAQPMPVVCNMQPPTGALPHALASHRKARSLYGGPKYRYANSADPFYPVECDGVIFDCFQLRVVYEQDRTGFEECKEFPIQVNSIVAARYQVLSYLGSAAFSRAVQCLDLQTGELVCMKIIKNEKDYVDQSLDEIKLLRLININVEDIDQKHCLKLVDYFYHKEHLIIVTELLRDNLYEFATFNKEHGQESYFTVGHLQKITKQLLTALEYVHSLWLIHADLKPENILIKSYSRCEVKLIDFGSSCFVDDRLSSYVQSRSYRAPEVLLGLPYGQKVDMWSLGCVIAELWTGYVLFQNDSVQSLLARIIGIIGRVPRHMLAAGQLVPNYFTQDGRLFRELELPPPADPSEVAPRELQRRIQLLLPKRSSLRQRLRTSDDVFIDFLSTLLAVDPSKRPSATDALRHSWFDHGRYTDGL